MKLDNLPTSIEIIKIKKCFKKSKENIVKLPYGCKIEQILC